MDEHRWNMNSTRAFVFPQRVIVTADGPVLEQFVPSESGQCFWEVMEVPASVCDEILRLAALTGGEASNRYLVESLRKIRKALKALGLWRKRENGQGGTGDCAIEAIARIAPLEAEVEEAHRLGAEIEARADRLVKELEAREKALREALDRAVELLAELNTPKPG